MAHIFDRVCQEHAIEHHLTKVKHSWINRQVEGMNRTRKEATVKRYRYPLQQPLKEYLYLFLKAYNFAKRLKTLRGLTPDEKTIQCWKNEPDRFINNPKQHIVVNI